MAEIISMQGRVYGGHYDDIAALIRTTGASEDPLIRKHHKAVLMEGLSALFNRDRSEKGVFTAGIYAHQLADYVDARALENIDAQAAERADQLMEIYEWGPVSRDQDLDPEVFEHALRYVGIFSNAHERWPMAESAMEDYPIANDELTEEEDEEEDDFDWTDGPVFQILSSLADLDTQD
ncbi:hypothetical protein ACI2LC_15265 [Nonomuraea wenchangensis]|uniref:hypothetical protein n=1 Tax=Nonomuraea wenchangensis TaxID=568860 RepID=UPI00384B22D0